MSSDPQALLCDRASAHSDRLALVGPDGRYTYGELLAAARRVAATVLGDRPSLCGARVAYLVSPSCAHVAIQWGIWLAGGVAVPLCLQHSQRELAHALDDSDAELVIVEESHPTAAVTRAAAGSRAWLSVAQAIVGPSPAAPLPPLRPDEPALIVYTSGTTGQPKGAVLSHGNLAAQIGSLVEAWGWGADDRILSVLPLHHIHGIVNVVSCALWAGGCCELQPRFEPGATWSRLADLQRPLTLFMAVPTIYARLTEAWERAPTSERRAFGAGCQRLRVMVSGSAALPTSLLRRWQEISGHVLLERYGMTEIGMALSNPLSGPRRAGKVGHPLPGVEVRLVDDAGVGVGPGEDGELHVRGPGVFAAYWGRPQETAEGFAPGGWFRTGDVARQDPEDGSYQIVGRRSVDIIKTGGYKVSALEIEEQLREHAAVAECAVVGLPDHRWGQLVVAAVVPAAGCPAPDSLAAWCRERLAPYKVPRRFELLAALPRNTLGKVLKPELAAQLAERAAR